MKKKVIFSISIFSLFAVLAWSSEMAAMWSNLYRTSEDLVRQYTVMAQIVQEDDRDLIPLMIEAQSQLLATSKDQKTVNESFYHDEIQKMIIREMGELRAAEGGDIVLKTVNETSDPYLKADAIRTLGKMGATEYVGEIGFILRNLNLGVTRYPSREETETVVLACVSALERMKQIEGFEPVFFVAIGGYARQISQAAENSLNNMIEDPSEPLIQILTESDDLRVKLKALAFAAGSTAPAASLVNVAAQGLKEGLSHTPDDLSEKGILADLRTTSCLILINNGFDNPEISGLLGEMLAYIPKETQDLNETLTCVAALGAGSNDESARELSSHLKKLNDLQGDGITITDQREIKATIQALGNTGNTIGRAELTRVQFSNWNSAVNREARSALAKLN
ncbi:MAG: hypothetical protein JEY99_08080 [Spirochaetales bacterium]|nr:hypothetical protein [Spirochaetales bacterium]